MLALDRRAEPGWEVSPGCSRAALPLHMLRMEANGLASFRARAGGQGPLCAKGTYAGIGWSEQKVHLSGEACGQAWQMLEQVAVDGGAVNCWYGRCSWDDHGTADESACRRNRSGPGWLKELSSLQSQQASCLLGWSGRLCPPLEGACPILADYLAQGLQRWRSGRAFWGSSPFPRSVDSVARTWWLVMKALLGTLSCDPLHRHELLGELKDLGVQVLDLLL